MKKHIIGCLLILSIATVALAEWKVEVFKENYAKEGIDQAVIDAMKEGALPVQIVETGLELEGLNPQNLVKALYCAGANGQDITSAALKYEISEEIIAAGYKKSVEECGEQVADSQAYTPVAAGRPSFGGSPTPSSGSFPASIDSFEQ
jgi:hypothetical protein